MTKPVVAAALNFFFPGSGYLLNGQRKVLGLFFLAGAIGLTWVELSVKTAAPELYWPMFGAVFVMNIAFAVDAFNEGRRIAGTS